MTGVSIWSTARESKPRPSGSSDRRTPFEHDYDRLLFSTPVRRLSDKTQVFPLEKNDSVRTRLTHSHEVSNLARSIGNRILRTDPECFGAEAEIKEAVPVILATVGLAHDLGNPPFGHQGEVAIGRWFERNKKWFAEPGPNVLQPAAFQPVPDELHGDFLKFEGNAQTLRLLSRLQTTSGPTGLNLTAATLAALMKYTVSSQHVRKGHAATAKFGFFHSEAAVVDWIWKKTGLAAGQRHPLTWLMEACDDAAYSILDVEDAIKKDLVSPEDLKVFLASRLSSGPQGAQLLEQLKSDFEKADKDLEFTRIREIKTSYIRTRLVEAVLTGAASEFLRDKAAILDYSRDKPLLECGTFASNLASALKEYARKHAYNSPGVLRLELRGAEVIAGLMDFMWDAITSRKEYNEPGSRRGSPKAAYVYSRISDSYRWYFENAGSEDLPIRYREMQLLTDMISGMTDGFAVDLYSDFRAATNA